MPRKQRFKPTRKQKPVPEIKDANNDDTVIGHRQVSGDDSLEPPPGAEQKTHHALPDAAPPV
jgi:hypothetical protein